MLAGRIAVTTLSHDIATLKCHCWFKTAFELKYVVHAGEAI